MANRRNDDETEKNDPTDAGYDEAAHRGSSYGVPEGRGGVFGTSGGGTYEGGMHVEERPAVNEGDGDDSGKTAGTGREDLDKS